MREADSGKWRATVETLWKAHKGSSLGEGSSRVITEERFWAFLASFAGPRKRYLAFAWEAYDKEGGWGDLMGAADTLEEAQALCGQPRLLQDRAQVVDLSIADPKQAVVLVASVAGVTSSDEFQPDVPYRWAWTPGT